MWTVSDAARAQLAGGHTRVTRVDVLHSGRPVYQLVATTGSVSTEARRAVLRNLTCTITDPTGSLSTGDIGDLLNPYECEIQPWRGVQLPAAPGALRSQAEELVPLGVFALTSRSLSGDGSVQLTGQDRAMTYQGPMANSLAISGSTLVEEAVLRLLASRNGGVSLLTMKTGFTCGPLLFPPDIDVWREAQKLAESVGGRLYHNRTGQAVFAMAGPTSRTPVASYKEGDGLLLSVDRAEDSDTIRNVVVAESTNGAIRVVVEDADPKSPTYASGRYGRRPVAMTSQHFTSINQAKQAAAARLSYELGRSETVDLTAVPHPGLDVDDVISVHRPRAGLERRGLIVASIDLPLGAGEMKVGCRKSVIAPNGAVFEADQIAA